MRSVSVAVMTILLTSCASVEKTEPSSTPTKQQETAQLSDRARAELYQAILAAEIAESNQDKESALTHYLYALSYYADEKVAKDAVRLAIGLNDSVALLEASKAWLSGAPDSVQAQQNIILAYIRLNEVNSALNYVKQLIRQSDSKTKAFEHLSAMVRAGLSPAIVELWQQLHEERADELSQTLLAFTWREAAVVAKNTNYLHKSSIAIDQALAINPDFNSAVQLKYQILRDLNTQDEALDYLISLTQKKTKSSSAYFLLAQHYFKQGEYSKIVDLVPQWQDHAPEDKDAAYLLAISYYSLEQYDNALEQFKLLAAKDYQPDTSYYYCGDSAERLNQTEDALACLSKVGYGKYWLPAQRKQTQLLLKQNRSSQALKQLKDLIDKAPPEYTEQLVTLRADLLQQLDRSQEALDWLSPFITPALTSLDIPYVQLEITLKQNPQADVLDSIDYVGQRLNNSLRKQWYLQASNLLTEQKQAHTGLKILDNGLKLYPQDIELQYARALTREQTGQYQLMEQELKSIHAQDPENPHIKNALGYTLADQKKELDFALTLIQEAFDELPDSAAVLDSLGWVYYRLGKLDQAEEKLKASYNKSSEPEVASHLIEVLWQNGKKEEARTILTQNWKLHPDNKHLKAVLERLNIQIQTD
ncbi:CDC27 family protein [Pleionea sp. CnH1-48]|uniref:CDC27 family protein n=1 Tax=Pleionea sp. CnH1-48 TaxID=2954494 RepID=UPI002097AECF|nr:tetratricopeptide repeat protein [Pleionea sp. CnH1-48]MCO7224095.1 hypothetical protein [Pleionea sp. CnH1-48]